MYHKSSRVKLGFSDAGGAWLWPIQSAFIRARLRTKIPFSCFWLFRGEKLVAIAFPTGCTQAPYAFPDGRNAITAPTIALAMPPRSNHSVLFVGAPVKNREIPELAESDALNP
jgi:hypothetical protein